MITSNSLPELNTLRSYDNGNQIYFDWVFKEIVLISVFIKVYIAMIKHHNQKQFWKDSVYFTLQLSGHTSSLSEVRAGTQGRNLWQEVKQRPWRSTAYWLVHSACFLRQPRTTCPGMSSPTVAWTLPHQSLIRAIVPTGQYYGGIFSVKLPFSQIRLVCILLTKTHQHNDNRNIVWTLSKELKH